MDWVACLRRTVRYIEDNLTSELDIASISRSVYVSPFYLQRGFQMITGCAIGEYIRNRRLYEAALVIARGEERIIDTALRFCYDTPESFSKAFTRFHGATPSAVRADPRLIRTFLPFEINITVTGGSKMNYKLSDCTGFKIIGFQRYFSADDPYGEIPKFWDEFFDEYGQLFAGKKPESAEERAVVENSVGEFGVCIDDVGVDRFRYIIGGRYAGGEVLESMTLFEVPACTLAEFTAVGPLPQSLQSVNTYVFKEWLPGNPDYEMALPFNIEWYSIVGMKDDADYESGVWLPVRSIR